ncbi:MAG: nucleoside deaminase [Thermodesulfobacteriota bacterium]
MENSPSDRERTKRFLRRAIELARKGLEAGDGGPFGALVVKGDEIVGEGWNRVVGSNDPTAHGEIVAIREACRRIGDFRLEGCELYTSFEPCPMCLAAAYWARIDRVYYGLGADVAAGIGFDDRFLYEQMAVLPEKRKIPCIHVADEEAQKLLKAYAADPDRARY